MSVQRQIPSPQNVDRDKNKRRRLYLMKERYLGKRLRNWFLKFTFPMEIWVTDFPSLYQEYVSLAPIFERKKQANKQTLTISLRTAIA